MICMISLFLLAKFQIRQQHDSQLVLPLAASSKMTEICGWIVLSYHQYEIGCPDAVENVVNLRFLWLLLTSIMAPMKILKNSIFRSPEFADVKSCRLGTSPQCLTVLWLELGHAGSRKNACFRVPRAKRCVHFFHFHCFLLPKSCLFWRNFAKKISENHAFKLSFNSRHLMATLKRLNR